MPQDVWCVSIGFIRANSDTGTANSVGGTYRCDTGVKVSSTYADFRMKSGSTIQQHRTYLYYSTASAASLSWAKPMFYVVDGSEPTLSSIIQPLGATVVGTTINNNADNRIITGSGTADTLNAESGLTYDGTTLSGNAIQMSGNINASQVSANNVVGNVFKIGTTTVIDASRAITAASVYATEYDLPSGGMLDWANGDARIVEGLVNNYSLSFQTYDGSNVTTALRLDGNNAATFAGGITATTFNASGADTTPAGTAFQNTMRSSSTRVLYLDGNGATSLWQGSGNTAHAAIDTDGTYQSFWANNGSGWQKQMQIARGFIDLRNPLKMNGTTVIDASRNATFSNGGYKCRVRLSPASKQHSALSNTNKKP